MSNFVYFIPGLMGPVSHSQIAAAGFGYAFPPGRSMSFLENSAGAGGVIGALASADAKSLRLPMDWVKHQGGFVGVAKNKADRPVPRDLQRTDGFVDGHGVVLGDKQRWVIPVVRFADGNTSLPCVLRRKADGGYGYEVREEYRFIYKICAHIVDRTLANETFRIPAEEVMAFVVGILAVNYCVSEVEIDILELIDTRNAKAIANAALDVPSMMVLVDELKKKLLPEACVPGPVSGIGANV